MATAKRRGNTTSRGLAKKGSTKKAANKKSTTKKAVAKKKVAKRADAPKKAARSVVSKETAAKKSPEKKAGAKATLEKTSDKKSVLKKPPQSAIAKTTSNTSVSSPRQSTKPSGSVPASSTRSTASQQSLTAEEKKKLATQHMWELVQAKKQRAAQPPAWQAIEHHDHPAPQGGQPSGDSTGAPTTPGQMPGHHDRGNG